jgi:hypothetical protein
MDSLHWFASAKASLGQEAAADRLASKASGAGTGADAPTTKLTLKRLEKYQSAMDLLRFNLNSARIFFHWASASPGTTVVTGSQSDSGSVKGMAEEGQGTLSASRLSVDAVPT